MKRLHNLGLVFLSPGRVAENTLEDPHWVLPLMIVVVMTFVFTVTTHEFQVLQQREVLEKVMEDSGQELDIDSMMVSTPGKRMIAGATAAGMAVLFIVVASAVLNGFASIAGGQTGFVKMFSFYAYASMIGVLAMVVKLPLVLAKGSLDVRTSAAAFSPSVQATGPLGIFLNSIDVFSIWMVGITAIGFSVLSALGIRRSVAIVVGLWVLVVVLRVAMAVLGSKIVG
jgi:hypothetical protein